MTVGNFIVENFFEMFEFLLSYVSNTMSFLRVGGFVLSHAGMMLVVMTLMEMCSAAAIGLDGRKHRRNLNVLVCGGSGAGKTRFYAKPNIMNANTSFVVLDPKG